MTRKKNEVKSGTGQSEAEILVSPFARAADISMKDALAIVENPNNSGVAKHNAAAFEEAVAADPDIATVENLVRKIKTAEASPKMT